MYCSCSVYGRFMFCDSCVYWLYCVFMFSVPLWCFAPSVGSCSCFGPAHKHLLPVCSGSAVPRQPQLIYLPLLGLQGADGSCGVPPRVSSSFWKFFCHSSAFVLCHNEESCFLFGAPVTYLHSGSKIFLKPRHKIHVNN